MIPLAAALYFLANLSFVGGPFEAWGVQGPLTKHDCDMHADRQHVCVPLPMPKRDPRCYGKERCQTKEAP